MTSDSAAAPISRRRATSTYARQIRRFPTPNTHERIHAAAAEVVAEMGLKAATSEAICRSAGVSLQTFHSHFATAEEAALSAVESGADIVMAECRAAFSAASEWPRAVWDACSVYLDCTACEPDFAQLAIVEILSAGEQGLDLLRSLMDAFAIFLAPGYELAEAPEPRSLDEAVAAEVLALLHDHILSDSPQTLPAILPDVVRSTLTPFLGEEQTVRVIAAQIAREGDGGD